MVVVGTQSLEVRRTPSRQEAYPLKLRYGCPVRCRAIQNGKQLLRVKMVGSKQAMGLAAPQEGMT